MASSLGMQSSPSRTASFLKPSSSLSRCCSRQTSLSFNGARTRISSTNTIKCDISEPLNFGNGKPTIPVLNNQTLPKFLESARVDKTVNRNDTRLKLFSGTANPALSQEVAWYMGLELGKINIKRFADGEIYVQLQESVRGCDVFLLQPTCPQANENLMELLIMIDACRRASAKNITAVIPYFGYARADRKTQGRESIAAKLVANLITEAGATRILACDLHSGQSMGYFDIPVDHVYGQPVILDYLASKTICFSDLVVVSPDVGGVARARAFAKKLSDAPGIQSMRKTASQLSATGGSVPPSENKEPTIQQMVFNLLTQILSKVEKDKPDVEDEDKACLKELNFHYTRLSEREEKRKLELVHEEAEAKKHITSEDVHDGFDVSYVDKTPSKAIDETAAPSTTTKSKKTNIEVLNPNSVDSSLVTPTQAVDADSSDDEELPQLSSSAMKFAKIKASNYPASLAAIQADPSLYLDELTTDALLVEAFEAEMRGAKEHARNCVHQGLLLQYCRKLGKDGVSLFFRKVGSGEPRAMEVFITDVQTTYERIAGRCKTIKEERASDPSGGKEQIQLVATNPTTSISFEIPEGPPPEDLRLQTEDGTEAELDVEEVRGFLNDRWETFCSFPKKLQKALQTKELEKVNKVLGEMEVPEAEKVVQDLDRVGILSFSESGIIDQTGKESVKNEEDQKREQEEEQGKVDEDHEAEESGKNSIEIPE